MGDANGVLHVSAEDKGTGNKEQITITNDQNRLSPEDIERMVNDAEKFKEEDEKVKAQVEARNGLESMAYQLKNQLGDKATMEAAIEKAIKYLDDNPNATAEELEAAKKEMESVAQPIVTKLYGDQAGQQPPPEGGEGEKDEL